MNPIVNSPYASIEQITGQYLSPANVKKAQDRADISFGDILQQKQIQSVDDSTLKFSKHATMRLASRNIDLTQNVSERLQNGVEQASQKGIKESLVLVDQLAFIVNVPHRTVVTAMDQSEADSNVFTNIDGAVIM